MHKHLDCVFCGMEETTFRHHNQHGFALRDLHPVTRGHTLIISKRHVSSFFELTPAERLSLLELLDLSKQDLDREFRPDDYNIGVNDGPYAGQTIPHVHIHLIPRYAGEPPDPRGGVRLVIPDNADYWSRG